MPPVLKVRLCNHSDNEKIFQLVAGCMKLQNKANCLFTIRFSAHLLCRICLILILLLILFADIFEAAEKGRTAEVREFVTSGVDVNGTDVVSCVDLISQCVYYLEYQDISRKIYKYVYCKLT